MSSGRGKSDKVAADQSPSGSSSSSDKKSEVLPLSARLGRLSFEPTNGTNANTLRGGVATGTSEGARTTATQARTGSTGGRFQVGRDAEDDVFAANRGGGVSLYPSQPTIAAPSSVDDQNQGYESNQPGHTYANSSAPSADAQSTEPINLGFRGQGPYPQLTMRGPYTPYHQPAATGYEQRHDGIRRYQQQGPNPPPVDAQTFYPANACVFVANLPENLTDAQLEAEVTQAFSAFGTVFVKIRRDSKNMPFAFCQYVKADDAKVAVTQGKGITIGHRPCRTEMVKANRMFVIYNQDGEYLSLDEARSRLSSFGQISRAEPLHSQVLQVLGISNGVLVEFATFDPHRDVVAAFRYDQRVRVIPYDIKKINNHHHHHQGNSGEDWLRRYDADRRSIFIGNLPGDRDDLEDIISAIMESIGDVESVNVVKRAARNGYGYDVFAFVQFARPDMADIAIQRTHGIDIGGHRIRVERKSGGRGTTPAHQRTMASGRMPASPSHDGTGGYTSGNSVPVTPLRSGPPTTSSSVTRNHQTSHRASHEQAPAQQYMGQFTHMPATPQGTPGFPVSAGFNPVLWATPYMNPGMAAMPMPYYAQSTPAATASASNVLNPGQHANTPTRFGGSDAAYQVRDDKPASQDEDNGSEDEDDNGEAESTKTI